MFRLAMLGAITLIAAPGLLGCQRTESAKAKTRRATPSGAPAQSKEELDAPLATIGDVTITVREFEDQLDRQAPYIKSRYSSLEQKKEFLDSLVRFEVLAAEAKKRGLDQDPEVIRTMKSVMVQKLLHEEFEKTIPTDSITDAEVKTYYDAHTAEYVRPEQVRCSAIVVKDKTTAEKIATEAAGDAGKTNKGFRDMVDKYSLDDTTKTRGGDLRYFAKDGTDEDEDVKVPAPVIVAAFALPQTGSVSAAIDAGNGTWWILKETGHRRPMTKSLDEVATTVRAKLARDKRVAAEDDFVAKLKESSKIEIDEDNLAKVRIDVPPQEAAAPDDTAPPPNPPPAP
jgi:peptidyl-prolyl cis-trans isomerase C